MKYSANSITAVLVLALSSCSDDPKLVEKREQQKAEIARLKGEIALIEEKLKNLPADVSSEFAEAKQIAEKQGAEVGRLEAEVASLDARKNSIQKQFDAYRIKYQVK